MELAEYSLPKTAECESTKGKEHGEFFSMEKQLQFCSVEEGIARFFTRVPSKKPLYLTDGASYKAFARRRKEGIFLVLEGKDTLPLFALPPEISCVLAAGEEHVLRAARLFATVQKIPCALFPSSCTLSGALESEPMPLGGASFAFPLNEGNIYCDEAQMRGTLARGYARLLLLRLALVEGRILRVLDGREENENREKIYQITTNCPASFHEIVRANAQIGKSCGEGLALAKLYEAQGSILPEWHAFDALCTLYGAFLRYGKPRRFYLPDYRLRAEIAGKNYCEQNVPTTQEYRARALALERGRQILLREMMPFWAQREIFLSRVRQLYEGRIEEKTPLSPLKKLPEYAHGLCEIVRDFGLLDWN